MSLLKLQLVMLGTLAMIIGVSTVFFVFLLEYLGSFDIISLVALMAFFNVIQWFMWPHLIKAIYRVKEAKPIDFIRVQVQ